MKKFIVLLVLSAFSLNAQEMANDVEITAYINENNTNIPAEARQIMLNKLADLLTKNGVSKGINTDIILTANTNLLGQEITPTAPANFVVELSVNLYIGNGIDGNLFNSTQISVAGVGQSETKAYIDAIKKLSYNNKKIEQLIFDAKVKIKQYYNERCDLIIAEAKRLEKTNNYDAALYKLLSIPLVSTKCYSKSISLADAIFQKSIDFDCRTKLNTARQIFNASPNEIGAFDASRILMQVNPNSKCFPEVRSFGNEISKKMRENDARDWNVFYENAVGLEKDRIQAMKEIGKAFGLGQPRQVINNIRWW